MGDFFKSRKFKVLIALFIMLIALMLRASWTGGLSPAIEQVAGAVVAPFQKLSSTISDGVSGFFRRYAQLVNYEEYKHENEELRKYLDIEYKEEHPDFEMTPAAVVARDPDSRFYSFTIDKGSLDGVAPYDPVVCADGLVGRVKEVGLTYSKVITILDVEIDVGAYDARTRDIGIVNGSVALAADGRCIMNYLPRESGAAQGDLVVTSGGNLYPKGLVIGKIARLDNAPGNISLYAEIEPTADIRNLTDVMVITSFNGQKGGAPVE